MNKIKVTHINPTDIQGGASLAGYRLHKILSENDDIDSVLFVGKKYSNDKDVFEFRNIFTKSIEKVCNLINNVTGLQYLLSFNWINLLFSERFRETDVFIIRNIHGGYLPFWFPWIISKIAPVIWRLPDEWSYTGHCSYSYSCDKWINSCGNCPNLNEYPRLNFDTTKVLHKLKKYFYNKSDLYMVGPSRWMCENLKKSSIFCDKSISYIPIGINTEKFTKQKKFEKISISFVSFNLNDYRKGGLIIEEIFFLLNNYLSEKKEFIDVYLIGKKVNLKKLSNIKYIYTGYLDESEIVNYYARTHLNIIPTLGDNLPNTILESLSCGTPVVSFDTGGCKDLVIHKKTGYLSEYNNLNDFVSGIIYFLENKYELEKASMNAENLVKSKFTMEKQMDCYIELIKRVTNE